MPLHVDIKMNDTLINQIHIGRFKGGTDKDDINDYLVVEGEYPTRTEDYYVDGISYTHRYGDGAEVCVIKALQALGYEGEQITRS
jgi:hypothetical protein